MIICIDPGEVRSSWGPLSIPTGESASSRGGGPDLIASDSVNPGTVSGNCLHMSTITSNLMASSGSEACSGQTGVCGAVVHSSWGYGSPPSNMASSAGFGEARGSSSTTSSMEASTRSSLLICGSRHLWRSWIMPQSMPGETLTVWHTAGGPGPVPPSGLSLPTGCSWGPGIWEVRGRKSWHPKLIRLGGAFHQHDFPSELWPAFKPALKPGPH